MNNSESARRGFRTFILTLSVSLIVFSAVYYALTTYNPNNKEVAGQQEASAEAVAGNNDTSPNVQGAEDERTVFGTIMEKKPDAQVQEVLAGATSAPSATESTSSVPVTGFTGMTVSLALSLALFIGAMIYNFINPRKVALASFEKKIVRRN